jgi:hypothetical protein
MSGRPIYTVDALNRIAALGDKSISVFFNEIPRDWLTVVTEALPPAHGFRPGSFRAVQRQLQALAQKIVTRRMPKVLARSGEENVLYGLWQAWSRSKLQGEAIRDLFNWFNEDNPEVENGTENKYERTADGVKALVANGACARESLERFVIFSPFADVTALLELARKARTSAEIKRDSTLLELPDRLHKDETRLQLLETKVDASDRSISLIRSELNEIRRTLHKIRNNAAEDHAAIEEARRKAGGTIDIERNLDEAVARLTGALDRVVDRIAASEKQVSVIADQQTALRSSIARITEEHSHHSEKLAVSETLMSRLAAEIGPGAAAVTSLNERLVGLEKLIPRIDGLETLLFQMSDTECQDEVGREKRRVSAETTVAAPGSVILIERLKLQPGLPVRSLHSVLDVLQSLDSALIDAGLKKSTATFFSEEILASIASEQVAFFRGGFAVDVARKCALSICGASVYRVAVPLGLTDPSLLRQQLAKRSGARGLSAIVIEGVNNSPLDLLRDVLFDQVTYRVGSFGHESPTIVFANLVEGAGAFPLESSYLELGPVFDLENMDWRRIRRERPPALASVSADEWQSIGATWDGKPTDCEEALQGARRFASKRSTRFEANIVRSFTALEAIRRDPKLTALQSVTFGWLAPYWHALGTNSDEIDALIDGGKCDGDLADERLKRFLDAGRAQWPAGET